MNVYVPLHVVLLLRRIVNVLSTLSISNQYYLLKNPRAEEDTVAEARPPNEDCNRDFSWDTLRTLRVVKWRWWWWSSEAWDWPKFLTLESVANAKLRLNSDDGGLNSSTSALSIMLANISGQFLASPFLRSVIIGLGSCQNPSRILAKP